MRGGCAGGCAHPLPLKKLSDGTNSIPAAAKEEKGLRADMRALRPRTAATRDPRKLPALEAALSLPCLGWFSRVHGPPGLLVPGATVQQYRAGRCIMFPPWVNSPAPGAGSCGAWQGGSWQEAAPCVQGSWSG